MSKIIRVLNKIIEHKNEIDFVAESYGGTYFFSYFRKYLWKIKKEYGKYEVFFYPKINDAHTYQSAISRDVFSDLNGTDSSAKKKAEYLEEATVIRYCSSDYKHREAEETFADLYRTVEEKATNTDDIFDEILKTNPEA